MKDEKLKKALLKKALGYDTTEVIEEYAEDDSGGVKLIKKKVTKKNVPPDLTAIKMITDDDVAISQMSDEELLEEKEKLLKLIKDKEL